MKPTRYLISMFIVWLTLLSSSHVQAAKKPADFSGSWRMKTCSADKSCNELNLILKQTNDTLCGVRVAALNVSDDITSPREDSSTVMGTLVGDTAVITFQGGRNNAFYLVKLQLNNQKLQWQLVGQVSEALPDSAFLITDSTLEKFTDSDAQATIKLLQEKCNWPEAIPDLP